MALLEWKPAYSLAIPSVDLEHRQMIAMINECYAALDQEPEPQAVRDFLGDIHAGIAAHFALEERLMREAAFPGYPAHKEDHEALLDDIRELMDAYAKDPEAGRIQLRERLAAWFGRHFSTFDAQLHEQLGR